MKTSHKETSRYNIAHILPIWVDKSWDDFTNDSKAKRTLQSYAERFEEAKADAVGYYIYGPPGIGKSMVANLTMIDILDNYPKAQIRVITFGGLINLYKDSWSSSDARRKLSRYFQTYDIICIEDFGKEFYSKDSDGRSFGTSILEELLVKRLGFKKITFIVGSVAAGSLSKEYSEDLFSLINEACVPLALKGSDYRKEIQTKLKDKWRLKQ